MMTRNQQPFSVTSQHQPHTTPKYQRNQRVYFVGGTGRIKTCQSSSGTWTYVVEMELNSTVSHVGPETSILLYETDIRRILD